MFSSEIKEAVYIAISMTLLAAIIGFVAFLYVLRGDFADTRNREVSASTAMANYREFSIYTTDTLYREDVIAAILDFADSGIKVEIRLKNGSSFMVDKYRVRKNKELINLENLDDSNGPITDEGTTRNTPLVPFNSPDPAPPTKYKPVLVYGHVPLNTVTDTYIPSSGMDGGVSALVFFEQ